MINVNDTFKTFDEFLPQFRLFCEKNRKNYFTAESEMCEDQLPGLPPYKMKFYKCFKHSTGCNASIRLTLKAAGPNKNMYMVTRMNNEHNHDPECDEKEQDETMDTTSGYESENEESAAFSKKEKIIPQVCPQRPVYDSSEFLDASTYADKPPVIDSNEQASGIDLNVPSIVDLTQEFISCLDEVYQATISHFNDNNAISQAEPNTQEVPECLLSNLTCDNSQSQDDFEFLNNLIFNTEPENNNSLFPDVFDNILFDF